MTITAQTNKNTLLVSGTNIISFVLFVIFYFSLKGGYYFLHNRLQELGFLFALGLFAYSAMVAALNVRSSDLNWSRWILGTLLLLGYTMFLPAYLFASHNNVAMAPSVMASREFLISIMAPTLWFLYRIGYPVEKIERIFLITCSLLVLSYIFHYFRIDLAAAFRSDDPTIKGMVTYDDWRGYRLKPPMMALTISSITAPYLIFKEKDPKLKTWWIFTVFLCFYSWFLIKGRSAIAMMIMGVAFYHLWFARKNRLGLFFMSLPVLIPALTFMTLQYFDVMKHEDEGVRYRSYSIAFDVISEYPLFGFGIQSAATMTEQQIFWKKFYSADIGIVGIAFKYGIVGASMYYIFTLAGLIKAIRTNWLIINHGDGVNIILMAAIVKIVGDVFKFLLSIDYMYIQGIMIISYIFAISAIYRHHYKTKLKFLTKEEKSLSQTYDATTTNPS